MVVRGVDEYDIVVVWSFECDEEHREWQSVAARHAVELEVSSEQNFCRRQKNEMIFDEIQNVWRLKEFNRGQRGLEPGGLYSNLAHDFVPVVIFTTEYYDRTPHYIQLTHP